jgi:hypothetical protein
MVKRNKLIQISVILVTMALLGGLFPAASAQSTGVPCCPIFADYPDYPYGVDPYYQLPAYCLCPFLDDALARFEEWNLPSAYWDYVIASQNAQCSNCTGSISSISSSISYSNSPLIIPEKDALMTAYDKISVSTEIKSKDQVLAGYIR